MSNPHLQERPILDRGGDLFNPDGCPHDSATLVAFVFSNGHKHIARRCTACGKRSEFYSRRELAWARVDIDALEVVADSTDPDRMPPCEVCGSREAVQEHHWAPVALAQWFSTPPHHWPMSFLCERCHAEWHFAVTPYLVLQHVMLGTLDARRSTTLAGVLDTARRRYQREELASLKRSG